MTWAIPAVAVGLAAAECLHQSEVDASDAEDTPDMAAELNRDHDRYYDVAIGLGILTLGLATTSAIFYFDEKSTMVAAVPR